jgi:Uma2 family endonuclease
MSAVAASPPMITEELLAMPRNGMERYLLRGQLREKPRTARGRPHTRTLSFVVFELMKWRATQSEPRGEILSGDAGFRILRDPDTTVGIDIAYISAELAAGTPANARLIDGPSIVAVEILSPSNNWDEVSEKVRSYTDRRPASARFQRRRRPALRRLAQQDGPHLLIALRVTHRLARRHAECDCQHQDRRHEHPFGSRHRSALLAPQVPQPALHTLPSGAWPGAFGSTARRPL